MPPEGFFVEGEEGPLKTGELERAVSVWAKGVISAYSGRKAAKGCYGSLRRYQ